MGRYAVIICPNCSLPQAADLKKKSTSCRCGYTINLRKVKPTFASDSPLETARAVAMAKAKMTEEKLLLPSDRPAKGRYAKIAAKAREIKDVQERLTFIASALTKLKKEFSLEDLEKIRELLGKESANDMLVAMRESGIVFETGRGKFRAVNS